MSPLMCSYLVHPLVKKIFSPHFTTILQNTTSEHNIWHIADSALHLFDEYTPASFQVSEGFFYYHPGSETVVELFLIICDVRCHSVGIHQPFLQRVGWVSKQNKGNFSVCYTPMYSGEKRVTLFSSYTNLRVLEHTGIV